MLVNCTRCGKMFQKLSSRKICPLCMEADEAAFEVARTYIDKHPGAEVAEVAEATGVEEALILRFLRDGRFTHWGAGRVVGCTQCGKEIPFGDKLCTSCRETLARELFPEKKRPYTSGSDARNVSFRAKHRSEE